MRVWRKTVCTLRPATFYACPEGQTHLWVTETILAEYESIIRERLRKEHVAVDYDKDLPDLEKPFGIASIRPAELLRCFP